jgi:hypothetical protein
MPRKVLSAATQAPRAGSAIQVEVTLPVRQRRPGGGKTQHERFGSSINHARTPRIARLMALAIKFQDMVDRREVRDYADIARLGYVTRARVTQIMNLLLLSPDIQEMLIFSACETTLSERQIRTAVKQIHWAAQRAFLAAK